MKPTMKSKRRRNKATQLSIRGYNHCRVDLNLFRTISTPNFRTSDTSVSPRKTLTGNSSMRSTSASLNTTWHIHTWRRKFCLSTTIRRMMAAAIATTKWMRSQLFNPWKAVEIKLLMSWKNLMWVLAKILKRKVSTDPRFKRTPKNELIDVFAEVFYLSFK